MPYFFSSHQEHMAKFLHIHEAYNNCLSEEERGKEGERYKEWDRENLVKCATTCSELNMVSF